MSTMPRRLATVTTIVAASALAFTGCAVSSGNTADAAGDSVTVALTQDPGTLNPVIGGSFGALSLEYTIFDQLTQIEPDGSISPRAASEWTSNEDFTVWDFTLDENITFHDGTPLTAQDVVFSFEEVLADPASTRKIWLTDLASVEAVDEAHVRFTLTTPFSEWPRQTTLISIVPEAAYTAAGSDAFGTEPVGSGPYAFESWDRGQSVSVIANEDYFGGVPEIASVDFVAVGPDDTRVTGVQSGTLDIASIPPAQIEAVESAGSAEVRTTLSHQSVYLGFNTQAGLLGDSRVREAISLAVDRDAIIDTILDGRAVSNSLLVSPSVVGYNEDLNVSEYDKEAAQALLAEAGYDGETFALEYALDGAIPMGSELAQAIAGQLEAVGISVELQGTDGASFDTLTLENGLSGIYLAQFSPSILDAGLPLRFLFGAEAMNYFDDAAIDAAVIDSKGTDGEQRTAAINEVWRLSAAETYYVGLYTPDAAYGVDPDVSWEPRPDGMFLLDGATLTPAP